MLDRFSATIEKIYSAAAGDCPWQDALLAIEDLAGCTGAVIDLVPTTEGLPRRTLAGSFSKDDCAEYARDYQAVCPRIRHAMENPTAEVQFDYQFMTEAAIDRDPVYEWFGKHGLRYYVGAPISRMTNYLGYLSLQRTRRQGHASSEDIALFTLLRPHIERAGGLADQLGTLRCHRRFSSAMLESLPQAVFALDRAGRILFANERGSRLAAAGDGLRIEDSRLKTGLGREQGALDAMIEAAGNPVKNQPGGWLRLPRPSGRQPYALFLAPLRVADEELLAAEAKVLVLVHDIERQKSADPAMLATLYGLTQTEARVASALSGGHSVESAAATLGMRPATARTHLKHVFRKLGVNRQQDLVRLLTSLSNVTPLV